MTELRRVGDVHLAVAALADLSGMRRNAVHDLTAAEHERWSNLPDRRADELLLGRHLLRALVRRERGLGAVDAVVVVARCRTCGGEHGRPEVPEGDLHLSVAHSGGLVVAAALPASAGRGVGVDVEPIATGAHADPRTAATARAWTRYEAAAKASGTGVGANPGETSPAALEALIAALPGRGGIVHADLTAIEPAGYAVAVAVLR